MVSFELGKELEKDVYMGQRKIGASERGESKDLRFDSSWGLRIFSFSHIHDKTKNIFP